MSFREVLCIELSLVRKGTTFSIPAGNVRACSLELGRDGFDGNVEFVLRDDSAHGGRFRDELAKLFLTHEELELSLSLLPEWPAAEAKAAPGPLVVRGSVTERELEELPSDWGSDLPLLMRRYKVTFTDAAKRLFLRHFPVQLYLKQSLLAVVKAEAAGAFEVTSSWQLATQELPQIFVHLPREQGVSFYDFVQWYVQRYGGCLLYDYETGAYALAADESMQGSARALFGDDVQRVCYRHRPRDPAQPRILNSYAPAAATEGPAVEGAIPGLKSDFLVRTAVLAEQDERVQREIARRHPGYVEVELVLGAFASALVPPGQSISCKAGQRFAQGSRLLDEELRVQRVSLRGRALQTGLETELGAASVGFELDVSLSLRAAADVHPEGRPCGAPSYPAHVEGFVTSQRGESADITWDMREDEGTRLRQVFVKLPLFEAEVSAPFEPTFDAYGTFRPRARDERLLVALGLHDNRLGPTLAFRPEAELSADVCGEQMVFGKSGKSLTRIRHQYEGDVPVFDVARLHEQDSVKMTLSEGKMLIEVAEEGG